MYISSHIMYILFISSGGIWQMADVIFFFQFNNNSNKKNGQTHEFNPTHIDWVKKSP